MIPWKNYKSEKVTQFIFPETERSWGISLGGIWESLGSGRGTQHPASAQCDGSPSADSGHVKSFKINDQRVINRVRLWSF